MKKLIFVISFIVLSSFFFGFAAPNVKAATITELQEQITKLKTQINELQKLLTELQQAKGLGEQIQKTERTEAFAPGRLLIRFKDNVTEEKQKEFIRSQGFNIEKEIKQIRVKVISVPEKAEERLAKALSQNPNVEYAEVDGMAEALFIPNDPYFTNQWGMTKIQAPAAWDIAKGSNDIQIAILDTGIDLDHSDLASKIISSINFSTATTVDDVYGHGTHVAGIAAAITNNSVGVAGLGYSATLMNVKVLADNGSGAYSGIASGIIWAVDNGAEVINMSLGGGGDSLVLEDAVNYAWSRGVVVVAAAGNNGSSVAMYPAFYTNCIAVAATGQTDEMMLWSNYGNWVDVAAPGGGIYSTINGTTDAYGYKSGTSMASPHVAGLAALVRAVATDTNSNGFKNDEVRFLIENTTDSFNWGSRPIINGRINAFSAVNAAINDNLPRNLKGVITGTGSGTINVNPPGTDYTGNFDLKYEYGTSVTLTATPDANSTFSGWSGDCAGTITCKITMTSDKSVTATFDTPGIIDCSQKYGTQYWCSDYEGWEIECQGRGDVKDLPEGTFCKDGLGKLCDKCVTCVPQEKFSLSINSSPITGIYITGNPYTYSSTTNYTKTDIPYGTSISLMAPSSHVIPGSNITYDFINWSGTNCSATSTTVNITMTTNITCTANYKEHAPACTDSDGGLNYYQKGTVTYNGRINTDTCSTSGYLFEQYCLNNEPVQATYWCPYGCQDGACISGITISSPNGGEKWTIGETHDILWKYEGTTVAVDIYLTCGVNQSLLASRYPAKEGKYLWKISENLQPGDYCRIKIGDSQNPLIYDTSDNDFSIVSPATYTLSVNSAPITGITIGSTSGYSGTTNYTKTDILSSASVSLTAPETYNNYTFLSWTGCDSLSDPISSKTCYLAMTSNRTVTANYKLTTHTLSVTKAGTGSGTITSNPSGINCGNACSASYNYGTSVTLTAALDANSIFAGWSGDCSGTGTCIVDMTSNESVIATFNSILPEGCTIYNNYLYCRGFRSTDPQGSSCQAACSARGYTCLTGDNMFRSLTQIAEVAVKLGLLSPGQSYSVASSKKYYSPYVRTTLSIGAKYIFYDPNWNQICTHAPKSNPTFEFIKICRCQQSEPTQALKYMDNQMSSLNSIVSKLIDQLRGLIGKQ